VRLEFVNHASVVLEHGGVRLLCDPWIEGTAFNDGRAMLDRAVRQCRALDARWLVPFASFVWLCHEENDYMNSGVVRVDEVARAVSRETATTPVVLYPGDLWNAGEPHDDASALARYDEDYASIPERARSAVRSTDFDDLLELSERFRSRINGTLRPLHLRLRMARSNAGHQRHAHRGPRGRLRAMLALLLLRPRPARIWIRDLGRSATFDLRHGLRPARRREADCDVALASDSLAYAFRFLWGGLSLQINGRFEELRPEGRLPLFEALWTADALNLSAGAEARPL